MPRKRTKDKWLPQRVYRGRSAFEYHKKSGKVKRLCGINASKAEVFKALANELGERPTTLSDLTNEYLCSSNFKEGLSQRTIADYLECWKKLEPVFGEMEPETITSGVITLYMDRRSSKRRANYERAFLLKLFTWAKGRDLVKDNPVLSVKPFRIPSRHRYITDEEYKAAYDKAPEIVKIFMELSYICAARGQDIRKIRMSDLTSEGLLITQAKTGKKQVKLWNNRLRKVIGMAKDLRASRLANRGHESVYLIVTSAGHAYTESGLTSLWARKGFKVDWHFHDLKAKAISDFEGDKQNFSGHKSRLQMEDYNRSPDKTNVIDWRE